LTIQNIKQSMEISHILVYAVLQVAIQLI